MNTDYDLTGQQAYFLGEECYWNCKNPNKKNPFEKGTLEYFEFNRGYIETYEYDKKRLEEQNNEH